MSFWNKTKEATKSGATATKEGAIKIKLKTEISLHQRNITKIKRQFGVSLFEVMETQRYATAGKPIFAITRSAVHDIETMIIGKENQIIELDPKYTRIVDRKEHYEWEPSFKHNPSERRAVKKVDPSISPIESKSDRPFKPPPSSPKSSSPRLISTPRTPPPSRRPLSIKDMPLCTKCGKHISSQSVQVQDTPMEHYHPDCFCCTTCSKKFTGPVQKINGQMHCDACAQKLSFSAQGPTFAPPKGSFLPGSQSFAPPNSGHNSKSGASKANINIPKNSLLQWAKNSTAGFNRVKIKNFTSSWSNGLAFAALVANYRPDCLNFSGLRPNNPVGTAKIALDGAKKAGVTILVDPEDVAIADRKSNMTQISMFQKKFGSSSSNPNGKKKWNQQISA